MKLVQWGILLALVGFSGGLQASNALQLKQLSALEWQYRVVIVAPSTSIESLRKQFRDAKKEIDARDLIWLMVNGETLESNYSEGVAVELLNDVRALLRQQQANVVLIGKDGGVKYRASHLNLDDVMGRIDMMPMRQVEMRERARLPRK